VVGVACVTCVICVICVEEALVTEKSAQKPERRVGALARQKICEEGGVGLARSRRWRQTRHEGRGGGPGGGQHRGKEEGTKANGTGGDEVDDVLQGRYLPKVQITRHVLLSGSFPKRFVLTPCDM